MKRKVRQSELICVNPYDLHLTAFRHSEYQTNSRVTKSEF